MGLWYHLSYTWTSEVEIIIPRVGRTDSDHPDDNIPFIAVCPTPLQCLIAFGDWRDAGELVLYKTVSADINEPVRSDYVFDYDLTNEHRFRVVTMFERVGVIDATVLAKHVPDRITCGIDDKTLLENLAADIEDIKALNWYNLS